MCGFVTPHKLCWLFIVEKARDITICEIEFNAVQVINLNVNKLTELDRHRSTAVIILNSDVSTSSRSSNR